MHTLLPDSVLQGIALLLFMPFDGLVMLYITAALFGLFQDGIVSTCAVIVREHFAASKVETRIGTVITAAMPGMALGGWLPGKLI